MNEFLVVLVINCGLFFIKFFVLDVVICDVLMVGIVDGMNIENVFLFINGDKLINFVYFNYEDVLKVIVFELEKCDLMDSVVLIGYCIVYGGELFMQFVIIIDEIIDNICWVLFLVLLYNYVNLSGIDVVWYFFLVVCQVVVFDISFYQMLVLEVYLYGLLWEYFFSLGVCCYGFYGMLYCYVLWCVYELFDFDEKNLGLIVVYLGNGVFICVVCNGQSVDILMGMMLFEGLMMGICSGDVDFGVMVWIVKEIGQMLSDLE